MNFWHLCMILILIGSTNAVKLRRCFSCRSRGDQGTCKDPLPQIESTEENLGIEIIPCASGWCGKTIEGGGSFRENDYDQATQRQCLQRGPSDEEERCAYTTFKNRRVYMCFCRGDLCNGGSMKGMNLLTTTICLSLSIFIGTLTR